METNHTIEKKRVLVYEWKKRLCMGCIEARRVVGKFHSVERVCGRANAANPIGRPISFGKGWLTPRLWSPFNYYIPMTNLKEGNKDDKNVGLCACICLVLFIVLKMFEKNNFIINNY